MKVASLEIELLANVARLQNDMSRATRTVDGAMQRIQRATAMAMRAIGALAGAFSARAIYQQVRNITELASRYNELGIVMNTVGRNAGYARPYLNELEKSLKATGISALESRSNIAKLIAANIDLTKATELARLAQDAAVIGGLNSSDAFARLTSGIQSAQVETLRTMGLNANFQKSYEDLAKELGKAAGDLSELEKTQARTNAVLALAPTIAGAYEASMTNAGKAMRSTQRYAEDLGVALGQAFQPAYESAVSAYTKVLKAAADNVDTLKRSMQVLTASTIPLAVAGITALAVRAVPLLIVQIRALTVAMMANPLGLIAVAAAAAITYLITLSSKVAEFNREMDALGAVWDIITDAAQGAWEKITGWLDNLLGKATETSSGVSTAFDGSFRDIAIELDNLYGIFAGTGAAIGALFEALGHNIREAFVFAFAKAREAASDMMLGLSAVMAKIGVKWDVTAFVGPAKADFVSLGDAASTAFRKAKDAADLGAEAMYGSAVAARQQSRAVDMINKSLAEQGYTTGIVETATSKLTEAADENTKTLTKNTKAAEAFAKARADAYRNHRNEISNIHQQAQALEDQVKVFGQGKHALDRLAIARLQEQAAILSGFDGAAEQIELIELEIAARERLMEAGMSLGKLEEQKAAHDEMLADWKQTVDEYDRVFRDGFADMLNNGKSGWKSFTKSLVTTFKTSVADQIYKMFAQPFVVNLVANMMGMTGMTGQQGGIAGSLQQGGGGAPGLNTMMGGGVGGYLNSFGKTIGSSMVADFGAGMTAGAANAAGGTFIPGMGVSATGGGLGAGAGTSAGQAGQFAGANLASIMGYAGALYELTQGNYGNAVGTAIGTAILPGIGTVVGGFLGSMVDGIFGHEPRTRHGKSTVYELTDDNGIYRKHDEMRHEDEYYRSMEQMTQAAIDGITNTFDLLGVDATLGNFWSRTDISTTGKGDGVSSGGAVMVGGKWIDIGIPHSSDDTKFGVGGWSDEPVLPRLAMDLQLTMLEAFQAASEELPTILAGMLEGVDIRGMDIEAAQALAVAFDGVIQQVGMLQTAVEILPFDSLRDLSFDAAANLIHFAGGLEALDAGMTSYFQNFYSQEEQLEWQTQQLGGAFESLGLEMPDVTRGADSAKAAYRELVEAQDVNTEAGAQAYAMLMTLSGGFAELVTGMDELGGATGNAMDRINLLASQLSRAFQLVMTGGNLSDRLGGMLGHSATFAAQREQQLWATISGASYDQQIAMSGELTDLVLGRISKEQEAEKAKLAGIQQQIAGLSRMRDMAASLQSYLRSLESSDLAPYSLREKVGNAESELARLAGAARGGDEDAMRQVQGSLQNALKLWREYGASGAEYQQAYHRLTGMVGNLAGAAVSDADRQIAQLEAQAASLEGISGYSAEQLAQLQQLYDITTAATEAAQAQEQMLLDATRTEIDHLESMGLDTARLHDIANLLQGLPASLAAQIQASSSGSLQYMLNNPDVTAAHAQYGLGSPTDYALEHYSNYGQGEGRDFNATREEKYLLNNPDVLDAYLQGMGGSMSAAEYAKHHYEQYGKFEGRAFALGGLATPGWALVGERGPELVNFKSPGQVYTADQTNDILRNMGASGQGNGSGELLSEVRMLRQEVAQLRQQNETLARAQVQAVVESSRENAKQISTGVGESVGRSVREIGNQQRYQRRGITA